MTAIQYREGRKIKGVKVRKHMIDVDESADLLTVKTYRGYEEVGEGDFIVTEGGKVSLIKFNLYNTLHRATEDK